MQNNKTIKLANDVEFKKQTDSQYYLEIGGYNLSILNEDEELTVTAMPLTAEDSDDSSFMMFNKTNPLDPPWFYNQKIERGLSPYFIEDIIKLYAENKYKKVADLLMGKFSEIFNVVPKNE